MGKQKLKIRSNRKLYSNQADSNSQAETNKINEIKRQEEKLQFIDSLLSSNCNKVNFLVKDYDFREDIAKFMIAKD